MKQNHLWGLLGFLVGAFFGQMILGTILGGARRPAAKAQH